jgi:hypothetical protein
VDEEIDKLGGPPTNGQRDSSEFEAIKREVLALPVVKKIATATTAGGAGTPPPPPSSHFAEYQGNSLTLKYPDNWGETDENGGASFAPPGGAVQGSGGQSALAYGMIVSVTPAQGDPKDSNALESATRELVQNLQKSNASLRVVRQPGPVKLNGQPGLSTYLSNDSPLGGQETDWLITVMQPEGLLSFLCVAPQAAYSEYDKTFSAVLDSVRLAK